jgi:transglutaminase-like putative cysteine protease
LKLQVIHRTVYAYDGLVSQSFNEVRLKPVSSDGQICDNFQLKILPAAHVSHYLDFYFNFVHVFEIHEAHRELLVESTADVATSSRLLAVDTEVAPMSSLPECARLEFCYDFLQSSTLVSVSPEVWRLAVDTCQGLTDVWQSAQAIMRFIHASFKYVPASTNVKTHVAEVLEQRRGVCQDFAHVMLAMCRAIRIPARYVSGYLYNGPSGDLVGSQASHAWCEIYLPGAGWRALDPTNSQQADERYVKLAVGRDYSDVAPVKGHFKGPPGNSMSVTVTVRSLV